MTTSKQNTRAAADGGEGSATLRDLIARLEKASGPDRELDAEIAIAVFETRSTEDDLIYAHQRDPGGDATHPGHYFVKSRSGRQAQTAPLYSASIDCALTLLPKDSGVGFDLLGKGNSWGAGNKKVRAWINQSEDQWTYDGWEGAEAASPALAICIAALRARLSQSTPTPNADHSTRQSHE